MTTSTVKHTPGPLDGSHCQQVPCTISGFYHIVEVGKDRPAIAYVCNKGDAHLYAAAPDLWAKAYAADTCLSMAFGYARELGRDDEASHINEVQRALRDVLSKAEAR